jgi:Asp-tRNA(Asn)/Glu-tRNA(Gln) amidotransferase A subunit family amidase
MHSASKPLHDLGVAELAASLRAGQVSAVEAAQHFLGRARSHESLGAFLAIDEEVTMNQARAADVRLAAGTAGPLEGVPLAHKDIFVTKDLPSTAGSRMLEGYRSPFDATVVRKLADAGVVTLGQAQLRRVCNGIQQREFGLPAGVQSVGSLARARRIFGRQRRRRGRASGAGRHRDRYRGVDPPAGVVLRNHRASSRPMAGHHATA